MNFDIDAIIFVLFFIATIFIGFRSSRGIKTVREYAVGNRNFSTTHITATIVATWVSGEFFITIATESYKSGLLFILVVFGDFVGYMLIGSYLAPRLKEFLGSISIAEAMGNMYGKNVRIVTALSGFIGIAGIIAIQLQIAGLICQYMFDIPTIYGALISGTIITLYSSIGGIKSVTFTDVMQFFTFCIAIPVILYFIIKNMDNNVSILDVLSTHPLFDYKSLISFDNPEIYFYISLFLWLAFPKLDPAQFQRISMSKSIKQVQESFIIASLIGLIITALVCMIGILVFVLYPNINADDMLKIVLTDYGWISGFKGLLLAGIIAMVMSTVDSYINSSAVLLIHDLRKSLNIKFIKNELFTTRIAALIIGIVSILFALREGNFFELILFTSVCYMPIVVVPFLMSLFGFRSSEKSVMAGMIAGFIVVVIWELFLVDKMGKVGGLIPGMLANLIVLFSYHYVFKQKGGWVGIKHQKEFEQYKKVRSIYFRNIYRSLNLDVIADRCKYYTPRKDGVISIIGFFLMVSVFTSVNTLGNNVLNKFGSLVDILYPVTLCNSAILIAYPKWLDIWKKSKMKTYCWYFTVLFSLSIFSFLTVIISNFSEIQLTVLMVNILVIATLCNWWITIASIFIGIISSVIIYSQYTKFNDIIYDYSWLEFKLTYVLLIVSSAIIIFLKPKEDKQRIIEQQKNNLSHKVEDQKQEIAKATEIKNEFLRNVPHESHTPLTTIIGFGEELYRKYDTLTEDERKEYAKLVYDGSKTLHSLVDNVFDLSKLSTDTYQIHKEDVNLSDVIYGEIERCKMLYVNEDEVENRIWKLDIDDNIVANCDKYYLTQTIHNLIANAIQYCKSGKIEISLKKEQDEFVRFTISDEGIGIPKDEMMEIFEPFMTSSKNRVRNSGRGIGLTLAKKVINLHDGTIKASNNSKNGSIFTFILPL